MRTLTLVIVTLLALGIRWLTQNLVPQESWFWTIVITLNLLVLTQAIPLSSILPALRSPFPLFALFFSLFMLFMPGNIEVRVFRWLSTFLVFTSFYIAASRIPFLKAWDAQTLVRSFLTYCGGLFFLLLLIGGTAYGVLVYRVRSYQPAAKIFIDTELPLIVDDWNYNRLVSQSAPELVNVANAQQLRTMFILCHNTLGSLENYEGATGNTRLVHVPGKGNFVIGEFKANANFQNAPASINITIVKRGDKWQVLEFYVNSDELLRKFQATLNQEIRRQPK